MFQKNLQSYEDHILKLITEQHSREIIGCIQEKPKSAIQISEEIGVILSMIYRRLHKFQKYDLVKINFQITDEGKKSYYYQSKIDEINASYDKGNFQINLVLNQI